MATRKPATKKTAREAAEGEEAPPVAEPAAIACEAEAASIDVSEDVVPIVGGDRIVVFFLEGQKYALPIDRVQEIQQIVAYTEVPDETGVVLGMVNLRGIVVPLVDLRTLVGLESRAYHLETPMIICRSRGGLVALVVDEVEDVSIMPAGCLQKASRLHALSDRMLGVCRMEPGLVFLLDIEKLVPEEAPRALRAAMMEEA